MDLTHATKECQTCGAGVHRLIRGECFTCYAYRREHHGEQRPISLIVAHARRVFERDEERKWLRKLRETA